MTSSSDSSAAEGPVCSHDPFSELERCGVGTFFFFPNLRHCATTLSILKQNLSNPTVDDSTRIPHHSFFLQCRTVQMAQRGRLISLSASFLLEFGPITICGNRFFPAQLPSFQPLRNWQLFNGIFCPVRAQLRGLF